MRVKNSQLAQAIGAMKILMTMDLPFRASLKIQKNAKLLDTAIQEFIVDERNLADAYIEKDDDGEYIETDAGYVLKDGVAAEYNEKHNELMEFETEIALHTIYPSEFDGVNIKPSVLAGIEFMIGEEQ